MDRRILVLYDDDYYDIVKEFSSLKEAVTIDLLNKNEHYWDSKNYTDLVCVGFSLPSTRIEELYIAGYNHILTIDTYYDNHPLLALNIKKDKMPFLDYRGKWAILLADESWYKLTLRNLISVGSI